MENKRFKTTIFGKRNRVIVERTEDLKRYYAMIECFPTLTTKEEEKLCWLIRANDEDAKTKLINCNLRAVVSIAKQYKYVGGCLSLLDLINEGNIGLVKAVEEFDVTKGIKFMSYAVNWIKASILNAITNKSRIVTNRDTSAPNRHESLDAPVMDDDDSVTKADRLESYDAESGATESLSYDVMRVLNSVLKPVEITIVCYSFGVGTERKLKWEIAQMFGKSEERIRQIRDDALEKIRNNQNAIALLSKYI